MRIHDEDDDDKPELNLAPLIDCLFFLLTFFIMTSTLQDVVQQEKAAKQLPLDLPESTAAQTAPAEDAPVIVTVDAAGRFYVENAKVGVEDLHRRLREAGQSHRKIRIEGDRRAAFDDIARVIDLCEFEGLREIAVRTRDER